MLNRITTALFAIATAGSLSLCLPAAFAADYPTPKQADWTAKDFKFHTGHVMPEMRLHYTTIGEPTGLPVLILHGTGGTGHKLLTPAFAGELFGPGQPLDASKYYIILTDALGHGQSAKPSDGMKTAFPKYDYDDMVEAQYRLVTEGLGIKHLRMVMGNSMGGMNAWVWGTKHPGMMDVLVPMASQPTEMSARNWMMRRMLVETIRSDPSYQGGNYTSEPVMMKYAEVMFGIATAGGTQAYQAAAPTSAAGDKIVDERLKGPFTTDANDLIYQWEASRDFDASANLEKIEASVLAINAADDERNPPETGIMDAAMKRIKHAQMLLIPASKETRGHSTTGNAKFFKQQLQDILQATPSRSM